MCGIGFVLFELVHTSNIHSFNTQPIIGYILMGEGREGVCHYQKSEITITHMAFVERKKERNNRQITWYPKAIPTQSKNGPLYNTFVQRIHIKKRSNHGHLRMNSIK